MPVTSRTEPTCPSKAIRTAVVIQAHVFEPTPRAGPLRRWEYPSLLELLQVLAEPLFAHIRGANLEKLSRILVLLRLGGRS